MKKGQQVKKSKTPPAPPPAKVAKQKPAPATKKSALPPRAPAAAGSRKKKGEVPYISLEQKTELSERINLLPPGKMHYALVMIKEMMPELGNVCFFLPPHTSHRLQVHGIDMSTLLGRRRD